MPADTEPHFPATASTPPRAEDRYHHLLKQPQRLSPALGTTAMAPSHWQRWVSTRENSDWDCAVLHIRDLSREESIGLGKTSSPCCFKYIACVRINYEMAFGNTTASRSLGWFPYMIYSIFIFIKGTEHSTYVTEAAAITGSNELVTWWQGLAEP